MGNNLFPKLIALLFFVSPVIYSQAYKSSWDFAFGVSYPRFVSSNVTNGAEAGYGGFLSFKRNFSEHVGFRLKGNYMHLEGNSGTPVRTVTNDFFAGNFDLLFNFVPCESISPFMGAGFGGIYYTINNAPDPTIDKSYFDYQVNLIFGAEWNLGKNWKMKTELDYFTTASSKFDGVFGAGNGLLGGNNDTYMAFDVGLVYYFSRGELSRLCDLYEGISATVDYDKIESIVKKYAAEPVKIDYNRIEEIVKKHKVALISEPESWVLVGINFDNDKFTLRPEAYPVLYEAVKILLKNPEISVEIEGYTDDAGSDSYNKKLSQLRAEAVKNFLMAKGISATRVTTVGYGESKPIADNKTAEGRAYNRRIEFKVIKR